MSRSMPNTMPRSFTCGRCSTTFQNFDGLQRHVDEMRHFRCMARFCQKDFDSRQELLAHRSTCRPPPPPSLAAAPLIDSPYPIAQMNVDIYARRERVLKLSQRADAYSPQGKNRFVYMDTDNIIFSMLNSPHLHPLVGAQFSNALRLHFDKFTQRVCQSAKGAKSPYVKMLSASYFGAAQVLAQSLVRFGWSVAKREGVTEADIDAMVAQRREPSNDNHNHKRTLVLVTGDAKVNHRHGSSFRTIALKYLNDGWNVEIHAWAHSIHESFIQLMDQFPTQCLVRLIDDSDDISALVYAGSYNPWQQAPVVAMLPQALPSPVFHSQPPSPSHSMASPAHSVATEFDFDSSAPAVVRSQLHQQEQLTAELQLANSSLAEKVRALEAQLAYERAANQQLVERLGDATADSHARVVPTATSWARPTKAVRST